MTAPLTNTMTFAQSAPTQSNPWRPHWRCVSVLALVAATVAPLAQSQNAAPTRPAAGSLGLRPLDQTNGGLGPVIGAPGYYFGTAAVNQAATPQTVTIAFQTYSDLSSYVPVVQLQYGISYSAGTPSCTESANPNGSSGIAGQEPYIETCTVPITFKPLYPGGHRDAILVVGNNPATEIGGEFLYGIGLAPQLMIQPGVTTGVTLSGSPYLYGSATDDAGTYYVYSNSSIYTMKEGSGSATQYISSFPTSYGLSIDGAGNLFSTHNNINTSGYEWQPSANSAEDLELTYTSLQDPTQNPQIVASTTVFHTTLAIAAGNLGSYYDADGGGEYGYRNTQFQGGLLFQPYGTQYPVTSPGGTPQPSNVVPAYGDLPIAYPTSSGSYSVTHMLVDSYENLFFNGNNGMAVWCGWGLSGYVGTPQVSSAVTGSTTGCASWGTSMVSLNSNTGGNMAVDAADTVYISQGFSLAMYSAANNYATPIASLGVSGGPGGISMAPDGTVYAQGGGTTITSIDRSQGLIDFGANSGQTSMTLYNGGNQPLTISSIVASGTGYTVQPTSSGGCATTGVTLAVGTICQLQVSFTKPHAGISTGAITIASNSLNNASMLQTIALTAEASGIYVAATPNPVAFGNQPEKTSVTLPITVSNSSLGSNSVPYGSTVAITTPLASSDPAFAASLGTCSNQLASGSTCQIQVTFTPSTVKSYTGTTISWTEQITGNGPTQSISLPVQGTGTAITPTMTWPQPAAITYGTPLSSTQLNATASASGTSVAGIFSYAPPSGTVLGAGTPQLSVTFTPNDTANYTTASATTPLTVLPAPLSVTIANASRHFLAPDPAFSYSFSGFVNGDTSAVVSGAPVPSWTDTLNSLAGTYPINATIGTLSATNYSFSIVPGTLTVLGGATHTINFLPIPNVPLAAGHITLTAHSTSGLPISYGNVTGPATLSGNKLNLTGAGTVSVTASQTGNSTFTPATSVVQTFTVTP